MTIALHQRQIIALGFDVLLDDRLGHLMVSHDGSITWDQLQAIKSAIWGEDARAIEVYPAASDVVNSGNFRHLWRLGESDFCPDLLEHEPGNVFADDNLEHRHLGAWTEAKAVFA